MLDNLSDNIAVIGIGATGFSVVKFLHNNGISCRVFDENVNTHYAKKIRSMYPEVEITEGGIDLEYLHQADLIIMSPGISPNKEPWLSLPKNKLISDIELFAKYVDKPVIAVTGSNGKSTVCALLASAMENLGLKVALGGNFGEPALNLLDNNIADYYVLELSSFQLELTRSLSPTISTILNISNDHIEWHGGFENYTRAKQRIYNNSENVIVNRHQPDIYKNLNKNIIYASYGLDSAIKASDFGVSEKRVLHKGNSDIIDIDKFNLLGDINILNYMAVFSMLDCLGYLAENYTKACLEFKGLEHRCQFFGSFNNIFWYNDSKATNSGATIAAVNSLSKKYENIILLAGGVYKEDIVPKLPNSCNVKRIVLFGQDSTKLAEGWGKNCYMVTNLTEAIDLAVELSRPGYAILLSPACASFDQFNNYISRGEFFVDYVKKNFTKT
jgi:UDP-N-acetylmuramoylalanine--D-glutamate ligase